LITDIAFASTVVPDCCSLLLAENAATGSNALVSGCSLLNGYCQFDTGTGLLTGRSLC